MSVQKMRTLLRLASEQGINIGSMTAKEFALFAKSVKL